MPHILIVGLPKGAGQLVDAFAKRLGLLVDRVYAQPQKEGSLALLPRPEHCLPAIRCYLDKHGIDTADYAGSHVIVLPYADLPPDCIEELDVATSMGAKVDYPTPEQDSTWPKLLSRRNPANQAFYVAIATRLREYLSAFEVNTENLPSDFIRQLAQDCSQFLIADGGLDHCDEVASHRYEFVRRAALALVDAVRNGLSTRFDEHCSARGIHHAQTGGSTVTVTVIGSPERRPDIVIQTHLKQGDRTTKEAAARLYYTFLDAHNMRFAVLLYAGPHPEGDFNRKLRYPDAPLSHLDDA